MAWPVAVFLILALAACAPKPPGSATPPERPPNVVLILADDLGYGDVGVYGSDHILTPHIDRLAVSGVRFTDGYVTAAVCSPARAALITGRHQQRFGYEYNDNHLLGLPPGERTLGERMRDLGYATGYVGKWHLGWEPAQRPHRRGFDEFFGIEDSGSLHVDQDREGVESWSFGGKLPRRREKPVYRGDEPVEEDEHLTDAWSREALAFIDRHHHQPFFLFLAYNAPHTPLQATARHLERYGDRDRDDPPRRIYRAMVSALDDGVGAVLSKLEHHGIERDTLVVFLSDNGCTDYLGPHCSNAPFTGGKRSHQEGGVRIPFVLTWPGKLPAGLVYDEPVSALDLTPTLVAAAGGGGDRSEGGAAGSGGSLDGVDLLPYLRGARSGSPHRRLFWRAAPNRAVREGPLKLWQVSRTTEERFARLSRPGPRVEADREAGPPLDRLTVLYDLANDPGEQTELAAERPEDVERLLDALDEWEAGLAAPSSNQLRRSAIRVGGVPVELVF